MNTYRKRKQSGAKGFVLLEALITLVLITFGFLAILKLQTTLVTASAEGKARTTAQNLAQQKLEELRNFIALTADHTTAATSPCTPSKWTGAGETLSIGGNSYVRSWGVAENCALERHELRVNVTWADRTGSHTTHLSSLVAWLDPGSAQALAAAALSAPTLAQPPANAVREDMLSDYDLSGGVPVVPGFTPADNTDGTWTVNKDGRYELIIADEDETGRARVVISSGRDFIKLRGRVMIHSQSGAATATLCNAVLPIPSNVGYCAFPLHHALDTSISPSGIAGAPISCSGSPTPVVKAAAYNCYVGEGWYGNLALYNESAASYFNGTSAVGGDQACSEYRDEGSAADAWIPGARYIRAQTLNASHTVIGQSGMLPAYTAALGDIDFIIYGDGNIDVGSGGDKVSYTVNRCLPYTTAPSKTKTEVGLLDTRWLKDKSGADILKLGLSAQTHGTTGPTLTICPPDSPSDCLPKFKPYDYVVAYTHATGAVSASQIHTISGTIALAGAATSPDRVNVSSSSGTASCATTYVTGSTLTYKCKEIDTGTGTLSLGATGGDVVCGTASYFVTSDLALNFTLKPSGSSCP